MLFLAFLWVHSPIYRSITTNHQKLNTAGRYYLVFFPIHIAAHIYGLIHHVIISLFGHLPVNHIQHTFFEQYHTIWKIKIKLTCGNLCSLLASSLSQFNSSIPSEGPGLLQPHISSSKAQSPALEEATWGEAVRNI